MLRLGLLLDDCSMTSQAPPSKSQTQRASPLISATRKNLQYPQKTPVGGTNAAAGFGLTSPPSPWDLPMTPTDVTPTALTPPGKYRPLWICFISLNAVQCFLIIVKGSSHNSVNQGFCCMQVVFFNSKSTYAFMWHCLFVIELYKQACLFACCVLLRYRGKSFT